MHSLTSRLFAAFAAIILLVICVVSLALLVLLRNSPLVERPVYARLHDVAVTIAREGLLTPPLSRAQGDEAARQIADTYNVRVLVLGPAGRAVLDVGATLEPPLDLSRLAAAQRDPAYPESRLGRARDTRGRLWLYVARTFGTQQALVLASPMPRAAILAFFAENLLRPLAGATALGGLVAGVLAVLIARWIARPLQSMAAAAQGIAQGQYQQVLPASGPREVVALSQALHSMAQQVQASQHTQRDFVANVSHELKTPLTSIQGFAQAILDGAVDSPQGLRRAAEIIYAEADRMRRLVEGLLELARLDAGPSALKRTSVDLRTLLAGVVDRFALAAREKGVTLRADLPPDLPPLVGDSDRLVQVFSNLVDNALTHTPAGGTVSLMAASVPGAVEVTVTDTGPGIPPKDLGRIFERFYQVDKSRARSGGMGLGLAICREIVAAHGGQVSAVSPPGQGATFVVRLPTLRPGDATLARQRQG